MSAISTKSFDPSALGASLFSYQTQKTALDASGVCSEFKASAKQLKAIVKEYLTTHPDLNLEAELEHIQHLHGDKVCKKIREWCCFSSEGHSKISYVSNKDNLPTQIMEQPHATAWAESMQETFAVQIKVDTYVAFRGIKKECKSAVQEALKEMPLEALLKTVSSVEERLSSQTLDKLGDWARKV